MRTALFRLTKQRIMVIPSRLFGTNSLILKGEHFFTLEDETVRLSQNVGKELPLFAV